MNLISLLLYPLMPFVSFILSIKRFKSFYGYISFILFSIYICYSMKLLPRDDMWRHIAAYNVLKNNDAMYSEGMGLYMLITNNFFASFNASPIVIYTFWAIVFYSGLYLCISLLLDFVDMNYVAVMILICACVFILPTDFLGIRFFTAGSWFIYGIVKYELNETRLYKTLPLLLCVLIHFTFIIPCVFYYAYKIVRPRHEILVWLVVASWFLSWIDLSDFVQSMGFFEKSRYLTSERNLGMIKSYNYGRYLYFPLQWTLWGMLYIIYKNRDILDETNLKLLNLALVILIMFNLVSTSWDATLRFRIIMEWIVVFPILYYYRVTEDVNIKILALLLPIGLFFARFDFFFVTGPTLFDLQKILLTPYLDAMQDCEGVLEKINYI